MVRPRGSHGPWTPKIRNRLTIDSSRVMNDVSKHQSDAFSTNPRLLWLAIVLVGVVYFYVGHNFHVSQYERYAPWSDADGGTIEAGGNYAKGLALSLIGLLGLGLLFLRQGRPLQTVGWLPALMIFYVTWSAASVFWSDDPGLSCRRLAVLMFCVLGALGFARQFQPRDIVVMAMVISGAYLLVGVGTELALGTFRPWIPGYRFAGTVHPNTQGGHLTVFCLASFWLARSMKREQARLWTLFAVGLLFLLLTKSRTSCAALVTAIAVPWLANSTVHTRVQTFVFAGFVLCAAALLGSLFNLAIEDRATKLVMLGRQEESSNLTGRLPIWAELSNYIRAKPLMGYGYESFWTSKHIEAVSDEMHWPLREAHNAYIDSLLGIGLIGTSTLLAIVILSLFQSVKAFRRTADPGFAFTLSMIVFGLFNACLESGMGGPNFITLMAGSGIAQLLTLPTPLTEHDRNPAVAGNPVHN